MGGGGKTGERKRKRLNAPRAGPGDDVIEGGNSF
jgi:hypothetical protein